MSIGRGEAQLAAGSVNGRYQLAVGIELAHAGLLVPYAHQVYPLTINHRAKGGILVGLVYHAFEVPYTIIYNDTETSTLITAEDIAPAIAYGTVFKTRTGHYLHGHTVPESLHKLVVIRDANVIECLATPFVFVIAKHIHPIHRALLDVGSSCHTNGIGHCGYVNNRTVIVEHDVQHVSLRRLGCHCQSHAQGQNR